MLAILIKFVHFLVCIGLIVIVLLQADKGEGLAGAFGGGASNTMFGERGAATPIAKLTTGMAIIFMITSLVLSIFLPRIESSGVTPGVYGNNPPIEAPVNPAGK
ncbi:MAG: preprotein translocase subunit SecG [Candidatus Riflebacteria bacterium]|nr:preprotein translocase subunit SecG [Candidatus Riflebacteria bacterium]